MKNTNNSDELPGNDLSFNQTDPFESVVTPEIEQTIKDFYNSHPELKQVAKEELDACREKASLQQRAWINTYKGKKLYPFKATEEDIDIEDVAHALSMICRFNGHSSEFYSVAQHSVLVSYLCDSKDSLFGLLHDASEYALGDQPSPLKRTEVFDKYREMEFRLQNIIYNKFCGSSVEPESVKKADILMLATEAHCLLDNLHPEWKVNINPLPMQIKSLSPKEAKKLFLDRFQELYKPGFIKYGETELKSIDEFIDKLEARFPDDKEVTITIKGNDVKISSPHPVKIDSDSLLPDNNFVTMNNRSI